MTRPIYRIVTRLARAFAPLVACDGGKLAVGLEGRAEAHERLAVWARGGGREVARPLVWLHAPSVGEGLQAQATLEALRAARPAVQVLFTHFSPSAEPLAGRIGADAADYLPWDLPEVVSPLLDALRPSALVFTKTEVWPELSRGARSRGVPTALVAGALPVGSSRARWPARWVLGETWAGLRAVGAIAEPDAARFCAVGVRPEVVRVTGDPGVDSAAARVAAADPGAPHLAAFSACPAPTLVAGSTWPADEAMLLPATATLRDVIPGLRLIVAPHEPTRGSVTALVGGLESAGWRTGLLSQVVAEGAVGARDAVVVDSVGRLAHLYTVADIAYVGGGFHGQGLHSVLEPAAAGVPTVVGVRIEGSRAASELIERGGAKLASDVSGLRRALGSWLADGEARAKAGGQARAYIAEHRGAAERTAELLNNLIQTPYIDD